MHVALAMLLSMINIGSLFVLFIGKDDIRFFIAALVCFQLYLSAIISRED